LRVTVKPWGGPVEKTPFGKVAAGLFAFAFSLVSPSAVSADGMDAGQLQIAVKVLRFLGRKAQPGATLLVLPGAADLDQVKAVLSSLTVVEGGAGSAAGAYAVFVNSASEAQEVTKANPAAVTVSGDIGCVNAGSCVMAIQTTPKVSIHASGVAAAKAGIVFDPVFKMLITEH